MSAADDSPLEPASSAELVARAIHDIDATDDEYRDALLDDLMWAAWGGLLARRQ